LHVYETDFVQDRYLYIAFYSKQVIIQDCICPRLYLLVLTRLFMYSACSSMMT